MRSTILLLSLISVLAGVLPAASSSSAWYECEGGKVRLVTTGRPDRDGRIRGVLDVALKPGWNTYWRDPGDSGVPPQLDISGSTNIGAVELSFPPPERHNDGYGAWVGYDRSVLLPVTFTLSDPEQPSLIRAHVFVGMCETICIPVQTVLTVDPASDPDNQDHKALADTAEAALPAPPSPAFGASRLPGDEETLMIEATVPGDPASADLFVAGGGDYMFGAPVRSEKDGKLIFSVPILDRPMTTPANSSLHYTLTSSEGAVAGLLPFP